LRSKSEIIVTFFVLAVLLTLGSFFDLPVAAALYNPDSLYAIFIDKAGHLPALAALAIAFAALVFRRNDPAWRTFAIVVLISVFAQMFVVQALKAFWGRPRFYGFAGEYGGAGADYAAYLDAFRPWFQRQGRAAGDLFKSFPSGHAADAAMSVVYALLCAVKAAKLPSEWRRKTFVVKTLAYFWIAAVMLGRMMAGAHFLSDVSAGVIIGFVCLDLTAFAVNRRFFSKTRQVVSP
jgi:membrane-associated phospholipid phosphatase